MDSDGDGARGTLHDALVDAALLPATSVALARAAFRLRTALGATVRSDIVASAHALRETIATAPLRGERVPHELASACARVIEWLEGLG
jgi:hypothetical protein